MEKRRLTNLMDNHLKAHPNEHQSLFTIRVKLNEAQDIINLLYKEGGDK
jgi:hypothetical protein